MSRYGVGCRSDVALCLEDDLVVHAILTGTEKDKVKQFHSTRLPTSFPFFSTGRQIVK